MPLYSQTFETTPEHSAQIWGSGSLNVFSTPAMVGLMEKVAFDYIEEQLADTDTTVGSGISVKHLAASPIGKPVTIHIVEYNHKDRVHTFHLEAYAGDLLIGTGIHTRVVITIQRFLEKLN